MIDVIVPTFRGADRVCSCLARLRGQDAEHRVIVVDDGSGDGTARRVSAEHPDADLVTLPKNLGFPRAANAGLRMASAEVVVLLNDDVLVEPGFLSELATAFADPDVGMAAPSLLRADKHSLEGIGIEVDRALAGFSRHWGAAADAADQLRHDHLIGPSGGAAAYRRRALDQVGHLDERILAYNEDLDLALRIRAAGWKCAPVPSARAVHLGSQTFGRRSRRQLYAKGFSRFYLLRKYGVLRRPDSAVAAIAGETTAVLWQLTKDRSLSGVRGRVAGWRAARNVRATFPADLVNPAISIAEAARRRRSYGA